jgi:hypothetical protein
MQKKKKEIAVNDALRIDDICIDLTYLISEKVFLFHMRLVFSSTVQLFYYPPDSKNFFKKNPKMALLLSSYIFQ